MKTTSRFAVRIAASLIFAAAASPSLAQATTPATAPAAAPTETQLRSYARAWMELTTIQRDMQPRLQAASGEARAALEREAGERMAAAVQRHGLDSDTFNRISAAMREDSALSQQVDAYVQEEAAGEEAAGGQ